MAELLHVRWSRMIGKNSTYKRSSQYSHLLVFKASETLLNTHNEVLIAIFKKLSICCKEILSVALYIAESPDAKCYIGRGGEFYSALIVPYHLIFQTTITSRELMGLCYSTKPPVAGDNGPLRRS